jgi:putative transposase
MPRKIRVEYPGAIYHLMSRGDRKEDIYHDDIDRQDFLKTLGEACQKTGWQVHAYCLMRNHFHLVVETPVANLVAGMRWLLSSYTIRLNHRRKETGHVFGGRYKALLVDGSGNGYLKTVCDYVHLNPVRAKLLQAEDRLSGYPWSSFSYYLAAKRHRPEWIRADRLLAEHGIKEDTAAGRHEFEKRMELRRVNKENDQWKEIRRGWCYGSDEFRKEMLERTEEGNPETLSGEIKKETGQVKAERIVKEELKRLNWKERDLKVRPKSDPGKLSMGARLRKETTLTIKEISQRLHLGTAQSASTNLHNWMNKKRRMNPSMGRIKTPK